MVGTLRLRSRGGFALPTLPVEEFMEVRRGLKVVARMSAATCGTGGPGFRHSASKTRVNALMAHPGYLLSAEELLKHLVPLRHFLLGLLRREEMRAEFSLR